MPNERFVQIMNTGGVHWITLSNIQSEHSNEIYVYDSLMNTFPESAREKQLKHIACMLMTNQKDFILNWADI